MTSNGPRCLSGGSANGPTLKRASASISWFSLRYPAKKITRQILSSSEGWKVKPPVPKPMESTSRLGAFVLKLRIALTRVTATRPSPTTAQVYL